MWVDQSTNAGALILRKVGVHSNRQGSVKAEWEQLLIEEKKQGCVDDSAQDNDISSAQMKGQNCRVADPRPWRHGGG